MIASGCAVNAATACSSPDVAVEAEARRATQASSVTIAMFDTSGAALGSCSGTLVAKDVVLTAGHCAAGAARWSIDARGADATSEATRAVTPWKAFGSDLSHPDHADVALLILDKPIVLESYPAIATSKLPDGAKALRFSRLAASATEPASTEISVSGMSKKGFRLNYAAKIDKGGFVDTGGAVVDPKTGKIHGVISGVGNESGLLHIARTDNFAKWISHAKSCASATDLATRTYGTSSSSSGGSGWGSTSSSGGAWPSGGDWGGYGGSGDKLDGGGSSSGSSGMDGGAGSSGTAGSSSGSSGTAGSSSGSSGSPGSSSGSSGSTGGGDTSGAGSSCPGVPACEGGDCPGVPGSGSPGSGTSGSSGSDGTTGASSGSSGASSGASSGSSGASSGSSGASSGSSGASSGSSGSSGSDGTTGAGTEVCPGPPNCPEPDSQACSGAACGGCGGVAGCVDATIDYGNCASCGTPSGTGTPPVVR
jgi:hypothetical protein